MGVGRRSRAWLAALAVLALILLALGPALHLGHHCPGVQCSVCACIRQARQWILCCALLLALIAAPVGVRTRADAPHCPILITLLGKKTRLNN